MTQFFITGLDPDLYEDGVRVESFPDHFTTEQMVKVVADSMCIPLESFTVEALRDNICEDVGRRVEIDIQTGWPSDTTDREKTMLNLVRRYGTLLHHDDKVFQFEVSYEGYRMLKSRDLVDPEQSVAFQRDTLGETAHTVAPISLALLTESYYGAEKNQHRYRFQFFYRRDTSHWAQCTGVRVNLSHIHPSPLKSITIDLAFKTRANVYTHQGDISLLW